MLIYKNALLQTVAYRSVRAVVNDCLGNYGLNISEWIVMGMVKDEPARLRITDIALTLRVKGAFITGIAGKLTDAGYLQFIDHPQDSRARLLKLTPAGRRLIAKIELQLDRQLKPLVRGLSSRELESYLKVIEALVENTATRRIS
jgi:MarR family transcriptional regulator for hemolysin